MNISCPFCLHSRYCLSLLLHSRSWLLESTSAFSAFGWWHGHTPPGQFSNIILTRHRVLIRVILVLHTTGPNTSVHISPGTSFPSRVILHEGENWPPITVAVWGCFAGLTHKIVFSEKILEELPCSIFKIIVKVTLMNVHTYESKIIE